MNLVKKILIFILGCLICNVLYEYVFIKIIGSIVKILHCSPESLLWLAFFIFMPICILSGSIFIGFNISKVDENKIINASIFNPGIYFTLESVIPTVREGISILYGFIAIESIVWIFTGFIGVLLGYWVHYWRKAKIVGQVRQ